MNESFEVFRQRFNDFAQDPSLEKLKLCANITNVEKELFETTWEASLYYVLCEVEQACSVLYDNNLFFSCMHMSNALGPVINEFMDNVRIVDLQEPRKANVLNMLKRCHVCMNMVADLSKLQNDKAKS